MAQIPTSSIRMDLIRDEVGLSGSVTLDACRAASNAFAMTSTSVPGHTRDGNEQTNTVTSPWYNTMAEWAGYVHSGIIGDITYLVVGQRRYLGSWSQTSYGLYETAMELGQPEESTADGGIYLYTKQVSGETWLYADRLVISENDATTEGRRITAWTGSTPTYDSMGSSTTNDGTGADVIVKIDEANVIVTCTVNIIHGWGDVPYLSGKDTPSLPSGHTYVANSAQGAGDVNVSGAGGSQDSGAIYRMELGATKSGFASKPINFGVAGGQLGAYSYHQANSDEEEE